MSLLSNCVQHVAVGNLLKKLSQCDMHGYDRFMFVMSVMRNHGVRRDGPLAGAVQHSL